MNIALSIKHYIKYIILKRKYSKYCLFDNSVQIVANSTFEGMSQLHHNVYFGGHLGYGSYIGPNSYVLGSIGRFTSIGAFVRVNNGMHPYTYPYVSTSPSFIAPYKANAKNGYSFSNETLFNEHRYADSLNKYPVIIGNDCWIGDGVFIVGGCHIADGAVVLAHAVVTKDVPPYAIVGGVPARVIGYRYSEEDIKFLQTIRWWENSITWLKENYKLFSDFKAFKSYYHL